ncbi:MAG TPA: hypothetical protein VFA09_00145 [Ktedonobacteraceae bacterium]|nr:hypothetical protein [Ktedonobacteraceae bacterium]
MDIFEESWAYQEMVQKGLQQGLEKGRQEGELRALRGMLADIVQAKFPELASLAKKQTRYMKDPQVLRQLTIKISIAQTAQEVEQLLLALTKDKKKHLHEERSRYAS